MRLFFIFIYILTKGTIKQESRLSRSWRLCVTVMLRVRLVRTVHFCKGSCSLELQSEGRLHQRRLDYHSGPELSVFTITQKQNVHLYTFVSLSPHVTCVIVICGLLPRSEADLKTLAAAVDVELLGPEKPRIWSHTERMGVSFI